MFISYYLRCISISNFQDWQWVNRQIIEHFEIKCLLSLFKLGRDVQQKHYYILHEIYTKQKMHNSNCHKRENRIDKYAFIINLWHKCKLLPYN